MTHSLNQKFEAVKACVLIPTYNNDATLKAVIENILEYTDKIIIVNDGSTDTTSKILKAFDHLHIITFEKNKGKGAGLRAGFKKAVELGFEHAITIDSDGQHLATDLETFLDNIKATPEALLVGARNMESENVPGKSSFGHKFSNFWYSVNTGIRLPDTQSGYRSYPVKLIDDIKWKTKRFEFEIEVLVRSAWAGIEVRGVPIDVYYPPAEERVSHFRTVRDFSRITVLNTIFVTIALIYFWPRKIVSTAKKLGPKEVFRRYFYDPSESSLSIASAIGMGVFLGIAPFWGWQIVLIVLFAHLLKLNKAIALLAGHISIPPMIPFILAASYFTGGWIMGSSMPESWSQEVTFELVKANLWQYIVGAFILAAAAGITFGIVSYILMLIFRNPEKMNQ